MGRPISRKPYRLERVYCDSSGTGLPDLTKLHPCRCFFKRLTFQPPSPKPLFFDDCVIASHRLAVTKQTASQRCLQPMRDKKTQERRARPSCSVSVRLAPTLLPSSFFFICLLPPAPHRTTACCKTRIHRPVLRDHMRMAQSSALLTMWCLHKRRARMKKRWGLGRKRAVPTFFLFSSLSLSISFLSLPQEGDNNNKEKKRQQRIHERRHRWDNNTKQGPRLGPPSTKETARKRWCDTRGYPCQVDRTPCFCQPYIHTLYHRPAAIRDALLCHAHKFSQAQKSTSKSQRRTQALRFPSCCPAALPNNPVVSAVGFSLLPPPAVVSYLPATTATTGSRWPRKVETHSAVASSHTRTLPSLEPERITLHGSTLQSMLRGRRGA